METRKRKLNILTYEEKYFVLQNYFEKGLTVPEISDSFNVGLRTVRDWLQKIEYDFGNIERLKVKEGPNGKRKYRDIQNTDIPEEIRGEILNLLKTWPRMGPLKIKQYFFRHHQLLLSERKIYFFLKEQGIIQKRNEDRKRELCHDRRFEYEKPLGAVQLDLLYVTLSGGARIYLVTFLDDYSRYVLLSKFIEVKLMKNVIKLLSQVVKIYGVMETLITDRGNEFVSWNNFTDFEELLCNLDIELIASGPEKPQNQGKIERWHKTFRDECERKVGGYDTRAQAEIELSRFVDYYNYERPHQGIGGLVPADRFYGLAEELEKELEIYRNGGRLNECIYVSCNIKGKKLVISGPRSGELRVYQGDEEEGPSLVKE